MGQEGECRHQLPVISSETAAAVDGRNVLQTLMIAIYRVVAAGECCR